MQRRPEQLLEIAGAIFAAGLGYGTLRSAGLVAQIYERRNYIGVNARRRRRGRPLYLDGDGVQLVLELDNDALGSLAADARNLRQPGQVAAANRGDQFLTLMPDKIFKAKDGPTPEADSSISKKCFSREERKPYSDSASSRTCVWINSVTSVWSSPSAA